MLGDSRSQVFSVRGKEARSVLVLSAFTFPRVTEAEGVRQWKGRDERVAQLKGGSSRGEGSGRAGIRS